MSQMTMCSLGEQETPRLERLDRERRRGAS